MFVINYRNTCRVFSFASWSYPHYGPVSLLCRATLLRSPISQSLRLADFIVIPRRCVAVCGTINVSPFSHEQTNELTNCWKFATANTITFSISRSAGANCPCVCSNLDGLGFLLRYSIRTYIYYFCLYYMCAIRVNIPRKSHRQRFCNSKKLVSITRQHKYLCRKCLSKMHL